MIVKGAKINDRYQIIKTLGDGGMANVYLAYDTILERNVAVKVLRGDLANDEKFVRRFQREALSASSLSHPNIVEMYDVGEDEGQYYIVMEYVDGKTLKQFLKSRGNLSVTEVMDIMLQLTDGMAHAHDSYIVHRDIKPQNIMILNNGLIKITDFGIAMAVNSTQLTQTNSVMGSVHYFPPEQANGKGSTIRSDIYSMGILMFELLTGKVPFKGENAVEIALKHLKEPLPSIKKALPSLPQSVENIILKATAKNPKNRFSDAREMYEDIKTALDESRTNEPRLVYKYSENDTEDTKVLDETLKEIKEQKNEEVLKRNLEEDKEIKEDKKKQKKTLIILLSIFTSLILVTTVWMLIYFNKSEVEKIIIPDVSTKNVVDASNMLVELGFEVSDEYKYTPSNEIEKDYVVSTFPEIGKKVKKGTVITLYLAREDGFTMENYIGKNYLEVKGVLENIYECNVIVEYETVKASDKKKKDEILKTIPASGEEFKKGSVVTIYIPKVEVKYPDFTSGSYALEDIQKFCDENELKLEVKYQENATVPEGTIIKQSRPKETIVVPGISFTITVSTKPEESSTEGEDNG